MADLPAPGIEDNPLPEGMERELQGVWGNALETTTLPAAHPRQLPFLMNANAWFCCTEGTTRPCSSRCQQWSPAVWELCRETNVILTEKIP